MINPTVLVLGARRGSGNIGDEIVEIFLENDWDVTYNDCETSRGLYAAPKMEMSDRGVLVVTLGTTSIKSFHQNNPYSDIDGIIRGCLTLPLQCVREYVEQRHERGGHIVLIGSYAHRHPFSGGTAYCAAKAGLDQAGRTLAWELTGLGYFVNVVHPYHVQGTPMWEEVQEGVMKSKSMTREEADRYAEKDLLTPSLTTPEEVAEQILHIVENPNARLASGSNIELFGGTR